MEAGKKIAEGKTKVIEKLENSEGIVRIVSKNTITAGDGKYYEYDD